MATAVASGNRPLLMKSVLRHWQVFILMQQWQHMIMLIKGLLLCHVASH